MLFAACVGLNIDNRNQRLFRRVFQPHDFQLFVAGFNLNALRKRNIAAAFEQLLFNLRAKLLDRVLLIFNHINVAHAQEAAEHPHIAAENNGNFFRLVVRDLRGHVWAGHGNSHAFLVHLRGSVRVHHKFVFTRGACRNSFTAKNGDVLGQLLHIQWAFHKLFAAALAHIAGLRAAAFRAHFTAPFLAVVQIFQSYVSAPAVQANTAFIVTIIRDILSNNATYRARILPSGRHIILCFILDFNAVPPFKVAFRLAYKNENVLHLVDVVHAGLRNNLLRVALCQRYVAQHAVVSAERVELLAQVQQQSLNLFCKLFVLFVDSRDAGGGDRGIHLAFDQLVHDVADVGCLFFCVCTVCATNVFVATIQRFAGIHNASVVLLSCVIQPTLPFPPLCGIVSSVFELLEHGSSKKMSPPSGRDIGKSGRFN